MSTEQLAWLAVATFGLALLGFGVIGAGWFFLIVGILGAVNAE